jgi:hypothetical protein
MKKSKEDREFEQMIREEVESGNPFAEGSYRSYAAKNRKKSAEKEIEKVVSENTIINSEPNEQRRQAMGDLFTRTALDILKPGVE